MPLHLLNSTRCFALVAVLFLQAMGGVLHAQDAEDAFNPELLYAPGMKNSKPEEHASEGSSAQQTKMEGPFLTVSPSAPPALRSVPLNPEAALRAIAADALLPSDGPEGRPLPLTGSWNVNDWGPSGYGVWLLKQGHHFVQGFLDPYPMAIRLERGNMKPEAGEEFFDAYYRPGLEFAREHKLPIIVRGWNWASMPVDHQITISKLNKTEVTVEASAAISYDGKLDNKFADPLGPVEPWQDFAKFWFGNALMRKMQEVYPDPPLVIFLNNNEAGELRFAAGLKRSDRFLATHGGGSLDADSLNRIAREGYDRLYKAAFVTARETLVSPGWKKAVRFVAYNTLFGALNIGNGGTKAGMKFDPKTGWTAPLRYDGDLTEFYSNDWQGGKSEVRPSSMQVEASNFASIQDWLLKENPDYILGHIFWDGGTPSNVFRGRRASSKTFAHISNGDRWDIPRYEGWVQFCLWATRPRLAMDFRGGEPLEPVRRAVFMALQDSVDRPWNHPVLREFWRKGRLVPNRAEEPWYNSIPKDQPEWLDNIDRWFLLSSDANPARETWDQNPLGTRLAVYALALELGEAPQRRWLVYAHAPRGARKDVGVMLPEFGALKLPSVPQSGSFWLVEEAKKSLVPVLVGGPDELAVYQVSGDGKWSPAGKPVRLAGTILNAPGRTFTNFEWDFGDGTTPIKQASLDPVEHTFANAGIYLVTLRATDTGGGILENQAAVYVGTAPDPSMVYDVALDQAFAWEGPWKGALADGTPIVGGIEQQSKTWWKLQPDFTGETQRLITYRHVPNAGSGPPAIATGVRFVDDPERGKVMEIFDDNGGLWMGRNKQTVMTGKDGVANRTVSFWFKADAVVGRQVLYASGIVPTGTNIYLDNDTLYAGAWAATDGIHNVPPPLYGHNWKGDWISYGPIEAGKWYQVTWILKDATDKVEPDKQLLYINGKLVGKAPGATIPAEYMAPRLGRSLSPEPLDAVTRFHDYDQTVKLKANQRPRETPFRGRFSNFRFENAANPPSGEPGP